VLRLVGTPVVAAKPKNRVRGEDAVLHGLREQAAQGAADVLDGLHAQTLLAASEDELAAVNPVNGGDGASAQLREDMQADVHAVDW
jgi:hypothetical protein